MALRRKGPRGHDLFPGFTDVYEIGVGSLAVVFRARELATNRQVALKLLNVRDASPRSIESFERESIALGALSSHPNIVTLYRTFRTPDGRPVLVLELCSGAVADRLHDGAGLPVTDAVSIGIKIAGALETAHRGGILHRDVKPQNILVTEFGEPALADFGVAMLQSATQTTAGLFDFTTLHAAPELLEGGGTSAATDVYELASSLYQLIAGQSAFRAYEGESPASVILRILRDPVRPLSGATVPSALSDLLIRAMSKEKDERPPTAAEFAAELADVEIAQGWNRTQFLIRDPGPLGTGVAPAVTRMPDDVPRGLPSTLAAAPAPLTPVGSPGAYEPHSGSAGPAGHAGPSGQPGQSGPNPAAGVPHEQPVRARPVPDAPLSPPVPLTPLARPVPAARHPMPGDRQAPTAPPVAPAPPPARDHSWSPPTIVTHPGGWTPPPAPAAAVPPVPEPAPEPVPEPAPEPAPATDWSTPTLQPGHRPAEAEPAPDPQPEQATLPPLQRPPDDWSGFAPPASPPAPANPDYNPRHQPEPQSDAYREPEPDPNRPELAPLSGLTASGAFPLEGVGAPIGDGDGSTAGTAAVPAAVPVWAVRAPSATNPMAPVGPQFSSDLSLDPMSLRAKATVRAGASAVTVDAQQLRLRTWFRSTTIAWAEVLGFETQHDDAGDGSPQAAQGGHIVALTTRGPVELAGTRRGPAELRYVHALLEAYRIRAQRLAGGYGA